MDLLLTLAQTDESVVKIGENIITAGLRDPAIRLLLVLSFILLCAAFIHIRYYRPSWIEEMKIKENIEVQRASQTSNLSQVALTNERTISMTQQALADSRWQLQRLTEAADLVTSRKAAEAK